MTKLTDTFPIPSTPLNPASTADVHAPHVIPPTFNVVVAMCVVGVAMGRVVVPLVETFRCVGAIAIATTYSSRILRIQLEIRPQLRCIITVLLHGIVSAMQKTAHDRRRWGVGS